MELDVGITKLDLGPRRLLVAVQWAHGYIRSDGYSVYRGHYVYTIFVVGLILATRQSKCKTCASDDAIRKREPTLEA